MQEPDKALRYQRLKPYREQKGRVYSYAILLNTACAVFAFVVLIYLINGAYEKQGEYWQTDNAEQDLHKNQILGIEDRKGNKGLPMRLKIPRINVDVAIEYVGMTPTGAMALPNNAENVGWFNLGPRPGEKGSAVIAGHFDQKDGTSGVFSNLYMLNEGDKLYIEDNKGRHITFVVQSSRTYDPGYANEVFIRKDKAHLNLITCDGVWDGVKKSYNKRLVVFADITDERENL